jgi:MFS family permease
MFGSAPGQSFMIAVFIDDMLEGTGLSRTTFSGLYAAGTIVSAFVSVAIGRYSDRIGLAASWAVVCVGLIGAIMIGSAASGAILVFIALSGLRSFGQGALPLVGTILVARSLGSKRGRALSGAMFGHTAAGMALPPLITLLIVGVGWRSAMQILAAAVAVLILPLAFAVRRVTRAPIEPDEEGMDDPTRWPEPLRISRRLKGMEIPTRGVATLLGVFAVPGLILTGLTFHAVSLLSRNGLDSTEAALALTVMAGAHAIGVIVAGVLADRVAPRVLLRLMAGTLLGGTALLLSSQTASAYIAFAVLGITTGLFLVANGVVWARTYGTHRLGRIQGLGFAAMISGSAIGPLPLAISQSIFDSYVPGIVAFVGLAALTLTFTIIRREPAVPMRAA